jgi:hypothetical protein
MKTLAKLTLTLMVITMIANTTFAESCFISKPGKIVEEYSVISTHVLQPVNTQKNYLLPNEKMKTTYADRKKVMAEIKLRELILSMQQEEAEINDIDFDTRIIFEGIRQANHFELTPEILSDFMIEEKEAKEELYFINLACTSPKDLHRTTSRTNVEIFKFYCN